jgi:hypothetical protein
MKKKVEIQKNYNFLLVFMAVVLSIIGAAWYLDIFSNSSINKREVTERVITTKGPLDISLIVPTKFSSEERFGTLTLSSSEGQISVSHNATNYDDLMSHLTSPLNKIINKLDRFEESPIRNYQAIKGFLGNKNTYYIYAGSAVYFLSTSSPELYDELDAIAQSFQYFGD